jgi:hypothetical protein
LRYLVGKNKHIMETVSYYHVCTEGLDNCDLFIDQEDFATGFNKLAIAFKLGPYPVEIASALRWQIIFTYCQME